MNASGFWISCTFVFTFSGYLLKLVNLYYATVCLWNCNQLCCQGCHFHGAETSFISEICELHQEYSPNSLKDQLALKQQGLNNRTLGKRPFSPTSDWSAYVWQWRQLKICQLCGKTGIAAITWSRSEATDYCETLPPPAATPLAAKLELLKYVKGLLIFRRFRRTQAF